MKCVFELNTRGKQHERDFSELHLNAVAAQRCGWGRLSSLWIQAGRQQVAEDRNMGNADSKLHFRKAVVQLTTKTQVGVCFL